FDPLRQWSAAQMSDGNRRVHQGTGDRCRWSYPLAARDRGPVPTPQWGGRTGPSWEATTARSLCQRRSYPGSLRPSAEPFEAEAFVATGWGAAVYGPSRPAMLNQLRKLGRAPARH